MNPMNYVYLSALLPDGTPAEVSLSKVLIARGDVRRIPGSSTTDVERREES